MIVKKSIICIGGTHYINANLELTVYSYEALHITGRKKAKMLVQWLKSKGVFNITLIEV